MHNSVKSRVAIQSDIQAAVAALDQKLGPWKFDTNSEWWNLLHKKCDDNKKQVAVRRYDKDFNLF